MFILTMFLKAGSSLAQTGQHCPGTFLTTRGAHGRTGQLFRTQVSLPPEQVHSLHGSVMSGFVSPSEKRAPAREQPGQDGQEPSVPGRGLRHIGAGQKMAGVVVITPEKHSWLS
jgi:hypothetical protein